MSCSDGRVFTLAVGSQKASYLYQLVYVLGRIGSCIDMGTWPSPVWRRAPDLVNNGVIRRGHSSILGSNPSVPTNALLFLMCLLE